jgi:hypothetical protein
VRQLLFSFVAASSVDAWSAIDDGVMGGLSRSRLRHDAAGHAVFEGQVSLENRGGFASVRSHPRELGASAATSYLLELCGDGRRYKLNLRTDDSFDGVNYQAAFATSAGLWTTLRLPLTAFVASFRGRGVPQAPAFDAQRLRQVGLMIADRQAGPFTLQLRSIAVE